MEVNINNNPPDAAFLDEAAAGALGTLTAPEMAQFNAMLAAASPAARQAAAELQETTARLAAASPYMEPPARLRAGILAATAPGTFKIKDYRRATGERRERFLRWGMAAAAVCLVWSGYDIMSARSAGRQLTTLVQNQMQQIDQLRQQLDSQHIAISAMMDPNVRQVSLRNSADQKIIGKMLVDTRTNGVMIVMPDAVVPPNTKVKLAIAQHGQRMEVTADAVGAAPGAAFLHSLLPRAIDPSKPLDLQLNDGPRIAGSNLP